MTIHLFFLQHLSLAHTFELKKKKKKTWNTLSRPHLLGETSFCVIAYNIRKFVAFNESIASRGTRGQWRQTKLLRNRETPLPPYVYYSRALRAEWKINEPGYNRSKNKGNQFCFKEENPPIKRTAYKETQIGPFSKASN